jgi:excisionase family DNA binding protein
MSTATPAKLLLRVAEVATMLAISRGECYRLIGLNLIPAVRIGGNVRIPAEAIPSLVAIGCPAPARGVS